MNYKIIDSKTTYIGKDVIIEEGVVIYPNNTIMGKSKIGKGTVLEPNNVIEDTSLGEGCVVSSSVVKGATIGHHIVVGPFAYLRPGTVVEDGAKIGSFVEVKQSLIGSGTKVPHLTYVGDATIGERCNIGCGVVFANYDGKHKYKSSIGDNCFIGSNSNIVAPVNIGGNSYIAAATTVTENVPEGSFIIGRVKQQSHEKLKTKYIDNKND